MVLFVSVVFSLSAASAQEQLPDPSTHVFTVKERGKKVLDDPTDLTVTRRPKDILPPEIWNLMTADQEEMKKETAELLGYTAPELLGRLNRKSNRQIYVYGPDASPG